MAIPSAKVYKSSNLIKYYAGFSEDFVKWAINNSKLSQDSIILDPWSGSGTTAKVSIEAGYETICNDINPATKLYTYTQLLSQSKINQILEEFENCQNTSTKNLTNIKKYDLVWFKKKNCNKLFKYFNYLENIEDETIRFSSLYFSAKAIRKQIIPFKPYLAQNS